MQIPSVLQGKGDVSKHGSNILKHEHNLLGSLQL